MRISRRQNMLVEPPASATGDIAFNLIVFFLVCASVQPDKGLQISIPGSETVEDNSQESKNVVVNVGKDVVRVDPEPDPVALQHLPALLSARLQGKSKEEDRLVVVKTAKQAPAQRWVRVIDAIKRAGGILVIQIEEERKVTVQ